MAIYTKPDNPRLLRTHPLARDIKGAWLFSNSVGRHRVVDHAYNATLVEGASGSPIVEARTRVTGRTLWFDTNDWMDGSDLALPSGTTPFTVVWRGLPDQASAGCIFGYGTSGTTGAFRAMRFNGSNIELLGWSADATAPHGLGATAYRPVLFAATYDGTNVRIYSKLESGAFAQIGSTTPLSLNLVKHATAGIQFGISQFNGDRFTGYYDLFYIYARALPQTELAWLANDPYVIFQDQAESFPNSLVLPGPVRITAEHVEVATFSTVAANARITAEHAEVATLNTVAAKARITAVHAEVLLLTTSSIPPAIINNPM